ncbi:LysR family transcriptional regulator [Burkholderia sp. Bp9143]|uniref:LysR substrate-binding domain-containing protein n=1 Tax=Burkholderia sp. Bp9143 TaxID=2184574 RepID=UPI000F592188|nr:LysR family transcriptional regulator [Burkholderia sp. Bp9143]RQR22304.1 LysR family transcriptional regulator [Burkholderia sp. Bp9143]
MDRLQAMQVFTRVVDTKSFTKAADTLELPRASVTITIQNLESYLGVRLMHRTTRRLSLTPDGAAYYERCMRILSDVEETEVSLQQGNNKPRGKIRIDVPAAIGRMIVIPKLADFHARYPDVELQLGLSDRPVDLIQERVDCVLRVGALQDSSLVARRIGLFECITCASPRYLESAGVPSSLEELAKYNAVNYFSSRTGRVINWVFLTDGKEIEVKMTSTVSVNEADAYVTCALEGFGLIQPPLFMVLPHLRAGTLREVLSGWKPLPMPISVVYPASRHLSAKVRVFVDWIAEVFEKCPLLSGRENLDAVCSKRAFEEFVSTPPLDTPVVSEMIEMG